MRSSAVMGLAVSLAGSLACGLPEGEYFGKVGAPDPTHLRYCNAGEPEYLDPALASSTTDMKPIYAMFDGLTDFDDNGLPEPSIATRWDISADQRRFTFHLRDDARWSNGSPIVAADFVYSLTRVLHPRTASKNAENLWILKNGERFTGNRVRRVMQDVGELRTGDVVEIVGLGGEITDDLGEQVVPDTNVRVSSGVLALRDRGAGASMAYAHVPAGTEVTLMELARLPDGDWAYVLWDEGDGVYGWVPLASLDRQPSAEVIYTVRRVPPEHRPGVTLPPDPSGTLRPTEKAPGAALLMVPEVLGIRAEGDHTLVLETSGPVPFLIDKSPQRFFRPTPRELVSRWPKKWVYPEHIATSGAFHLASWVQRDHIGMVRSDTFWGRADVKLERLTMYSMNDQAASSNYYLQGGCDAMFPNNIPSSYLPAMSRRKYKDFTVDPYLGIYLYLINTKRFPNVHFRRAINFAVDRSPIPNITRGFELPTAQFMPGKPIAGMSDDELALCGVTRDHKGVAVIVVTGSLCYVPPLGLDFDMTRARQELDLARKEMGAAFPRKLTIKFNTGSEGHKLVAEWMQQQLGNNLGVEVELESQEWKTFLKDTVAGEYDIARMGWIGNFPDPEAEFLGQFKCTSPDNRTKFCSAEYDRLLAEAETLADRKLRLAKVAEAERVMIEAAPILPLYVYTQKNLRKPYVRGMAVNLVDQPNFRRVWIDPAWRQHAAGAP